MAVVQTYGKIEGLIKNVLMSNGATQQDPNGRFYIDGQMVGVELSRAIAEAIYLEEIFQAGFNCTAKYTTDTTFGAQYVFRSSNLLNRARGLCLSAVDLNTGQQRYIQYEPRYLADNRRVFNLYEPNQRPRLGFARYFETIYSA